MRGIDRGKEELHDCEWRDCPQGPSRMETERFAASGPPLAERVPTTSGGTRRTARRGRAGLG